MERHPILITAKPDDSDGVPEFGASFSPSASSRRDLGFERTACACASCQAFCRFVPGRLGVDDPLRLLPPGRDPFEWAEEHLCAVIDAPEPRLVPARHPSGACHWLLDGLCLVHDCAPFGCAFFDAHMVAAEVDRRSEALSRAIREDAAADGLYARLWRYLRDRGRTTGSGDRSGLIAELERIRCAANP